MVVCELCGKEVSNPIKIEVAGTQMNACSSCKVMGKEIMSKTNSSNSSLSHSFYKKNKEIVEKEVISNATSKINSALAKKGLNAQQLARILNIKDTTLNKILSGRIHLDLETARKLENYFEITLTQEIEKDKVDPKSFMVEEVEPSSLGDLLLKKLNEKKK